MGREQDLLEAARTGDVDCIEKILGHKSKKFNFTSSTRGDKVVNYQDSNGYTALHHAALNGHKVAVEALLQHNASANIMDGQGCYPLHLSAWAGNTDICKTLITYGPSVAGVNQLSKNNETALLIAAQNGHSNTVSVLLECHGDPTILNNKGESALELASQYGRLDTIELLVRQSPSLLAPSGEKQSALHLASRNGHQKAVLLLLDSGSDINTKTITGSALHEAALFGKGDIVKQLIERGIDLTITDSEGRTVLDLLREHPNKTDKSMNILHDIEEYFRRGKQKLLGKNSEPDRSQGDTVEDTYMSMEGSDEYEYDVPPSVIAPLPPVIAPLPATRYSLLKDLDPLCSDKSTTDSVTNISNDDTYDVPPAKKQESNVLEEAVPVSQNITADVKHVSDVIVVADDTTVDQLQIPVAPPRRTSIKSQTTTQPDEDLSISSTKPDESVNPGVNGSTIEQKSHDLTTTETATAGLLYDTTEHESSPQIETLSSSNQSSSLSSEPLPADNVSSSTAALSDILIHSSDAQDSSVSDISASREVIGIVVTGEEANSFEGVSVSEFTTNTSINQPTESENLYEATWVTKNNITEPKETVDVVERTTLKPTPAVRMSVKTKSINNEGSLNLAEPSATDSDKTATPVSHRPDIPVRLSIRKPETKTEVSHVTNHVTSHVTADGDAIQIPRKHNVGTIIEEDSSTSLTDAPVEMRRKSVQEDKVNHFEGLLKGCTPADKRQVVSQIYDKVYTERQKNSSAKQPGDAISATTDEKDLENIEDDWEQVDNIFASFGASMARESVFVRDFEKEFEKLLRGDHQIQSVGDWLNNLGLGQYENTFVANGFDDVDFLGPNVLDDQDLIDIGVLPLTHRQQILQSAKSIPTITPMDDDSEPECIEDWLTSLRLSEYIETFENNHFDTIEKVRKLWVLQLGNVLGISSIGHRKRILASLGERPDERLDQVARGGLNWSTSPLANKTFVIPSPTDVDFFHDYTGVKSNVKEKEVVTKPQTHQLKEYQSKSVKERNEEGEGCLTNRNVSIRPPHLTQAKSSIKNWRHKPETLIKGSCNYTAQYLGSTLVEQLNGIESTRQAISKMKTATSNIAKTPTIQLSISYKGVKFIDAVSKNVICNHEVGNIFCACQDSRHMNFFAYITKDLKTVKHYCHVFSVRSMDLATEVILTLGEAFEVAYQMSVKDKAVNSAERFEKNLEKDSDSGTSVGDGST